MEIYRYYRRLHDRAQYRRICEASIFLHLTSLLIALSTDTHTHIRTHTHTICRFFSKTIQLKKTCFFFQHVDPMQCLQWLKMYQPSQITVCPKLVDTSNQSSPRSYSCMHPEMNDDEMVRTSPMVYIFYMYLLYLYVFWCSMIFYESMRFYDVLRCYMHRGMFFET